MIVEQKPVDEQELERRAMSRAVEAERQRAEAEAYEAEQRRLAELQAQAQRRRAAVDAAGRKLAEKARDLDARLDKAEQASAKAESQHWQIRAELTDLLRAIRQEAGNPPDNIWNDLCRSHGVRPSGDVVRASVPGGAAGDLALTVLLGIARGYIRPGGIQVGSQFVNF